MTEEYFGLSTDIKPTQADNGDLLTEIDTGKKFRFDEANGTWYEQPSRGSGGGESGGGGGSSAPVFIVSVTENETVWTCDKTWKEIADAYDGGKMVRFNLPNDNASSPLLGLDIVIDSSWDDVERQYYSYNVYYHYAMSIDVLSCNDENDYPTANINP